MIYFDESMACIRDRLFSILKNFKEAFPDNFEKSGLTPCKVCEGTGLSVNYSADKELTNWAPGNYCEFCGGLGFIGFGMVYDKYLCQKCNGAGCSYCGNTGFADWIQNAMGEK